MAGAVLLLGFAYGLAVKKGTNFGFVQQAFAVGLFELLLSGVKGVFVAFILGCSGLAGRDVDDDLEAVFQIAQALLFAGLGRCGLGKGGEKGGSKEGQGAEFHWRNSLYVAGKRGYLKTAFRFFEVACGLFDVAVAVGNAWQFVFDGGQNRRLV